MKTIKEVIYVGITEEYPSRIEEFFIYDFNERDVNVLVERITFEDIFNDGKFSIFVHVRYNEDYNEEPISDIIRKVFTNYKMELRIANTTGWRF